jgi:hypothetical protein
MSAGSVFAATNAGSKVGLEIWRIEKLIRQSTRPPRLSASQPVTATHVRLLVGVLCVAAVPVDPKEYGNFFSGDCSCTHHHAI